MDAAGRALGAAAVPLHWLLLFAAMGGNQTLKLQVWGTGERELLPNPKQIL